MIILVILGFVALVALGVLATWQVHERLDSHLAAAACGIVALVLGAVYYSAFLTGGGEARKQLPTDTGSGVQMLQPVASVFPQASANVQKTVAKPKPQTAEASSEETLTDESKQHTNTLAQLVKAQQKRQEAAQAKAREAKAKARRAARARIRARNRAKARRARRARAQRRARARVRARARQYIPPPPPPLPPPVRKVVPARTPVPTAVPTPPPPPPVRRPAPVVRQRVVPRATPTPKPHKPKYWHTGS
jgi:hypothetical protein